MRKAILAIRASERRNRRRPPESIPCPVCGGTLRYRIEIRKPGSRLRRRLRGEPAAVVDVRAFCDNKECVALFLPLFYGD